MEKKCIYVEQNGGSLTLSLQGIKEAEFLPAGYTIDDVAQKVANLLQKTKNKSKENIKIDLKAGVIRNGNKEIPLIAKEIMILEYFYKHQGEIITRKQLFKDIWKGDYAENTRTLDVHISRLRQKLGDVTDAPNCIQTIRGIGYKFSLT